MKYLPWYLFPLWFPVLVLLVTAIVTLIIIIAFGPLWWTQCVATHYLFNKTLTGACGL
jgi:hypothetical protein